MSVTRDVFQLPMGWLNAWAPLNIWSMSVTRDVSQLPMGWLNARASPNIVIMSVTLRVFQLPMGWLNARAPSNIIPMSVTRDVSQPPMGWLNARAPLNIKLMSVTRDVSQLPMGRLNARAPLNIWRMLVIRLVHVRSTSLHFFCLMRDRNSCPLRTTYRTPSITTVSPIRARGVATMVNPPGPARRFGTLITLTSCKRVAPFVRTLETLVPPISVTRLYRFAALEVVVRFFVGVDDDALGDFLFLSINCCSVQRGNIKRNREHGNGTKTISRRFHRFLAFLAFLAFLMFDSRTCLTVLASTVPAGVPIRL